MPHQEHEEARRSHDLNRQMSADHTKAAIESANVAIRSLTLVNGGAVVALLAFIGALESGDSDNVIKIDELVTPLLWFAFGVGFSAITAALAYFVNMLDADLTNSVHLIWDHPYVKPDEKAPQLKRWRVGVHVAAAIFAALALLAFFGGVFTIAGAIYNLEI